MNEAYLWGSISGGLVIFLVGLIGHISRKYPNVKWLYLITFGVTLAVIAGIVIVI